MWSHWRSEFLQGQLQITLFEVTFACCISINSDEVHDDYSRWCYCSTLDPSCNLKQVIGG